MLENLSEYEQVRLSNIQRNEDYLKSLGFAKAEKVVNDTASDELEGNYQSAGCKRVRKKSEKNLEHVPVLRRSTRGSGVQENKPINEIDDNSKIEYEAVKRKKIVSDVADADFEMPEPLPLSEMTSGRVHLSAQDLYNVLLASSPTHAKMIKNSVSLINFCSICTIDSEQ